MKLCNRSKNGHLLKMLKGLLVMTNLDSMFKSRDITLRTKVCLVKAMIFPVVMYACESWTVKKADPRRIDAFELWCELFQFSSVAQSCPTLCDLMDCSTPGFPVHHQLPDLTQTHVHLVGDAIQLSHPLSFPSPPDFNLSQHQGLFQ